MILDCRNYSSLGILEAFSTLGEPQVILVPWVLLKHLDSVIIGPRVILKHVTPSGLRNYRTWGSLVRWPLLKHLPPLELRKCSSFLKRLALLGLRNACTLGTLETSSTLGTP